MWLSRITAVAKTGEVWYMCTRSRYDAAVQAQGALDATYAGCPRWLCVRGEGLHTQRTATFRWGLSDG